MIDPDVDQDDFSNEQPVKPSYRQRKQEGFDSRHVTDIPNSPSRAPDVVAEDTDAIAEILEDHALSPTPGLVTQLDALTQRLSTRRAGEALRAILLALPSIPSVIALRLFILGQGDSYREAAKEAGCSHVAVLKQLKKLGYHPLA